jgi:hypothetical protein
MEDDGVIKIINMPVKETVNGVWRREWMIM